MGGLLVYSNYMHAINIVDPEKTQASASLFTTYALDYMPSGKCTSLSCSPYKLRFVNHLYVSPGTAACFFSEFLATFILVIAVLAVTDKSNGPPPSGLVALVLFILILGEGASFGMETAYALNPVSHISSHIHNAS